eukprot:365213-Chlamydomonas_euryale.AAC.16
MGDDLANTKSSPAMRPMPMDTVLTVVVGSLKYHMPTRATTTCGAGRWGQACVRALSLCTAAGQACVRALGLWTAAWQACILAFGLLTAAGQACVRALGTWTAAGQCAMLCQERHALQRAPCFVKRATAHLTFDATLDERVDGWMGGWMDEKMGVKDFPEQRACGLCVQACSADRSRWLNFRRASIERRGGSTPGVPAWNAQVCEDCTFRQVVLTVRGGSTQGVPTCNAQEFAAGNGNCMVREALYALPSPSPRPARALRPPLLSAPPSPHTLFSDPVRL